MILNLDIANTDVDISNPFIKNKNISLDNILIQLSEDEDLLIRLELTNFKSNTNKTFDLMSVRRDDLIMMSKAILSYYENLIP